MPIFDENRLKDEELFSGFAEDDGDTFSLNKKVETSETTHKPSVEAKKTKPEAKVITPTIHKVEQKKAKKKTYPLVSGFSIAAIIIALLLAGYYLLNTVNSPSFFLEHSSIDVEHNSNNNSSEEIELDNKIQDVKTEVEVIDTIATQQETSVNTTMIKAEGSNENAIETIEEIDDVEPAITKKKTTITQAKVARKEIVKPNKTKSQEEKTLAKKQNVVKPNPKSNKSKVLPKRAITVSNNDITSSKIIPTKKTFSAKTSKHQLKIPPASKNGLFTIQAYASESYDEASMWLKKLNRRNLNASIVPLRKRNKIVYTVRFGRFGTEAEARLMAMKLGLSRSYIDRIK